MYCIIKCTVQGKQARVKNANLRHPSSMCEMMYLNRTWISMLVLQQSVEYKITSWRHREILL